MKSFEEALPDFFKDRDFLRVVDQFHSSNWDKKNLEEKKNLFIELEKCVSKILEDETFNILFVSGEGFYGQVTKGIKTIQISESVLNERNQYYNLHTYFHERRHLFQYAVMEKRANHKEARNWIENIKYVPSLEIYNYKYRDAITTDHYYLVQPMESDAEYWGQKMVENIGIAIEQRVGLDDKFKEYIYEKFINSHYISKKETITQARKNVKNTWSENKEKLLIASNKLKEKKKDLKILDKLSDEKIYEFFNEFILKSLKVSERIEVLKELDKRERKKEGLTDGKTIFTGLENGIIEIDNLYDKDKTYSYSSRYLLSFYYDILTTEKIEKLINSKNISNKEIENLRINEYTDRKNRKINYMKLNKNPILNQLQPSYIYNLNFAVPKMKKIYPYAVKDITNPSEKIVLVDQDWQTYFHLTDQKRFNELVEEIYGKSVEEIQEKLIEKMKKNIIKSKAAEELEDRLKKSYQKKLQ